MAPGDCVEFTGTSVGLVSEAEPTGDDGPISLKLVRAGHSLWLSRSGVQAPTRSCRKTKVRAPILREDGTALIPLTRGLFAVVDIDDLPLVAPYNWHAVLNGRVIRYAQRSINFGAGNIRHLMMHRVLIGADPDKQVDHIDGDGLNNRRSNLRQCTGAENTRNRRMKSGVTNPYKGICFKHGRWTSEISIEGRQRHLGRFDTPEEAHAAYAAAARELHGEFARLA